MHEMALAAGILDIALATATKRGAVKINRIGLLIGEMAGVETEALVFCFQSLVKGTIAEGAALSITRPPLAGNCLNCGYSGAVEACSFFCPSCGLARLNTISGRELQVEYLEVD